MGYVSFVGAGCGQGMITVSGIEAIKTADVILYDNLIDYDILQYRKANCDLIYVGKREGKHSKKQDEINEILVSCTKKYNHVVRLKGGDSFVFGRGGEEAIALDKNEVKYKFYPGVSSCIAAAEAVGIPVTHRGVSKSFTVVTGHTADNTDVNYASLSTVGGTLIFLMGLSKLQSIATNLIENGMNESTPCTVVSQACSYNQKRYDGTLKTIATVAEKAIAPAVIIVGEVCKYKFVSEFGRKRILVSGTDSFCNKFKEQVEDESYEVITFPTIDIKPYKDFLPHAFYDNFDTIVFTSSNGVEIFFDELKRCNIDIRKISNMNFAVIGEGTANRLKDYNIIADLKPESYTAASLTEEIVNSELSKGKILILRSELGSKELNRILDLNNVDYEDVSSYTIGEITIKKNIPYSDYIIFASASGVRSYYNQFENIFAREVVCIGENTKSELEKYWSNEILVSKNHSINGIKQLIVEKVLADQNL